MYLYILTYLHIDVIWTVRTNKVDGMSSFPMLTPEQNKDGYLIMVEEEGIVLVAL